MTRRIWLVLAVALVGLVQGCCHHRCCRRPLFQRYRYPCAAPVCAAPAATCCHGGEAAPPAVIGPPIGFAPPLASPLPSPPPMTLTK
ncbi:MAG: hypothetical protein K2W96_08570 [Gemmataceae bacterium]|nr:hypothetical protein [Gemmataceae bacterium]